MKTYQIKFHLYQRFGVDSQPVKSMESSIKAESLKDAQEIILKFYKGRYSVSFTSATIREIK